VTLSPGLGRYGGRETFPERWNASASTWRPAASCRRRSPEVRRSRPHVGSRRLLGSSIAASGCVNLYLQLQARVSHLILQRKPHELSLVLPKKLGKSSGTLRTDRPASLLDVA
jgi:hypothetical protein